MFQLKKAAAALMVVALLVASVPMFAFADTVQKWTYGDEYEEGEYVRFKGSIYLCVEDHEASSSIYPTAGNGYWEHYKKGAGFKKGSLPNYKPDENDKDDDDKDLVYGEFTKVYEQDGVVVEYMIKTPEADEYEAKVRIKNQTDKDIEHWEMDFSFEDDEAIDEVSDVLFTQDEEDVNILPEEELEQIEANENILFTMDILVNEEADDEDEEDKDAEEELELRLPEDFELNIQWAQIADEDAPRGFVMVSVEDPDFDDDLFDAEVTVGTETHEIDLGDKAMFTSLQVGHTYTLTAEPFETDTHVYKPIYETRRVTVSDEELVTASLAYEKVDKDYTTGHVIVYVYKPDFDQDAFTPEITIDDQTKEIEWGTFDYFLDLVAGEKYTVEAPAVITDGKTYEADITVDQVVVKSDKLTYVLVSYEVADE